MSTPSRSKTTAATRPTDAGAPLTAAGRRRPSCGPVLALDEDEPTRCTAELDARHVRDEERVVTRRALVVHLAGEPRDGAVQQRLLVADVAHGNAGPERERR